MKRAGHCATASVAHLPFESYERGHSSIDAQHRRLFGFGNELINALMSETSKFELECLLTELVDQVTDHFRTEEVELAKTDKPLSIEHKQKTRLQPEARDIEWV